MNRETAPAKPDTPALSETLQSSLDAFYEHGDVTPLVEWACQEGRLAAQNKLDEHNLVEHINEALQPLNSTKPSSHRGGAKAASARPDRKAIAKAQSSVLAAAIEGYLKVRSMALAEEISNKYMQERVADLTALHRVISAANSSLKLTDMLNEIVQAVMEVSHADLCSIFLYEPEWDQLVMTATSAGNKETLGMVRLRMGEGITGWAALVGKPVSVLDAHSDERFKAFPVSLEDNTKSMLVVPIVLFTNEKLVGVIDIHTVETRDFTENEIKFLETVAGEIAIAIENARLYEQTDSQLRQKVTELSTLQGVSAHIASTLNLTEVLALIARQSAHLVRADAAAIYELHNDAGTLELVAQYDLRTLDHSMYGWRSTPRVVIPIATSRIARAVTRGVPMPLAPDTDAVLGVPFAKEDFSWMYCVPLVAPRGIRGGICLYNREEKTLSEDQVRLLDAFAREAAIALENSRLYDAALRGLEVKSAMLQEMNHRVRNNLQTVAGLLSMQLRRMPGDSDGATAVRESISRVQSIAVVHDLMVNGNAEIDSISIYDLARKVADAVISTLTRPGFKLKLTIEQEVAERIRVGSHEATLLALLLNELISNAILHGFANRDRGTIDIKVNCESERNEAEPPLAYSSQLITIEVVDDGSGLPEHFDPARQSNLGLKIVETLVVSDLGGTFDIGPGNNNTGTHAIFSFRPKGI